ncbi:DUF4145 domain-containing protein [Bradyrhizobium sp. 41S5]|uniref:DUF4145 domain-containing protein n=1 Tax=Bradyrhizobium sp. 41S5 TaxID=1404443 RepID=UPI00156A9634|nr:DUF4145 domain-containing protein [Bradyrhizobium sp. 41S5]UFX41828.1 DUF4145 domain-containing protein [Bradyrhizobium sp. 41S5]
MLFQIKHYCPDPKCGNYVDFAVSQVGELVKREPDPNDPAKWRTVPKNTQMPQGALDGIEGCGMSRCPHCGEPLLIVFRTTRHLLQQAQQAEIAARNNPHVAQGARILAGDSLLVPRTYPESRQPIAHATWPPEIQRPFVDLQKMLAANMHPGLIIAGCRSVLDVATKHLGGTSNNLFDRINELAQNNVITVGLKNWANKLRRDGNDATHELKGEQEEASQLVEFLKIFLHVAYELPAAIEEKAPADTAETEVVK